MFFIFFPIGVDRKLLSVPKATYALLLANTLVFVLQFPVAGLVGGIGARQRFIELAGVTPSLQPPWGLLTHMFVHGGLFHYLMNMLYLYLVGIVLEDRIGSLRTLLLYLVGGVFSAVVHSVMVLSFTDFSGYLIGASGAIAALMGAFVVLMPWVDFKLFYFFWFLLMIRSGTWNCPALFLLLLYFLLSNLFYGFLTAMSGVSGGVAYWAHVGGFVFGFALAGLLYGFKGFFMTQLEQDRLAVELNQKLRRSMREESRQRRNEALTSSEPTPSRATPAMLGRLVAMGKTRHAWQAYREMLEEDEAAVLAFEDQLSMLRQFLRQDMAEATLRAADNMLAAYPNAPEKPELLLEVGEYAAAHPNLHHRGIEYLERLRRNHQLEPGVRERVEQAMSALQRRMSEVSTGEFRVDDSAPAPGGRWAEAASPGRPGEEQEMIRMEDYQEPKRSAPGSGDSALRDLSESLSDKARRDAESLGASLSPIDESDRDLNDTAARFLRDDEENRHLTAGGLSEPPSSPRIVHPDASCCLLISPRREIDFARLLAVLARMSRKDPEDLARRLRMQNGILLPEVSFARGERVRDALRAEGLAVRLVENSTAMDYSEACEVRALTVREDRWLWRTAEDEPLETPPGTALMLAAGRVRINPGSQSVWFVFDLFLSEPRRLLRVFERQFDFQRCIGLEGFPLAQDTPRGEGQALARLAGALRPLCGEVNRTYSLRQWQRDPRPENLRFFKTLSGYEFYNRWHLLTHLAPEAE